VDSVTIQADRIAGYDPTRKPRLTVHGSLVRRVRCAAQVLLRGYLEFGEANRGR
jgi:hypothetical protein